MRDKTFSHNFSELVPLTTPDIRDSEDRDAAADLFHEPNTQ